MVLAAARVGGINANNTAPADFAYENMQIQCNVIECCHRYKVKKLLFLGSTCIYPRMAPQPIPEDALLTGPLRKPMKHTLSPRLQEWRCADFIRNSMAMIS